VDAGQDSPTPAIDGGPEAVIWDAIPGTDANCHSRVARNPSALPALKWKACSSGRPGCKTVETDWATNPGPTFDLIDLAGPVRVGSDGKAYLVHRRLFRGVGPERRLGPRLQNVVQDLYGDTVFASEVEVKLDSCLSNVSIGERGILLRVIRRELTTDDYRTSVWASPNVFTGQDVVTADFQGTTARAVLSGTTAFVAMTAPYTVANVDLTKGTVVLPMVGGARAPIILPVPVSTGAFVGSNTGEDFLANNGTIEKVLFADAGHTVPGFTVDRSGSKTLVWVDTLASGKQPTIFSAPYTESLTGLVPHRVTEYTDDVGGNGARMVANVGLVLNVASTTGAMLTRLSDGWSWSIQPEPGTEFMEAIWVDDQEVWLATGTRYIGNLEFTGMLRIKRADLGSPTIAPR
jgi:hypothetical protein